MDADDVSKMILALIVLAFSVSLLFGGCASSKMPPSDQFAETRTVIKQAEQVGAQDYAPLEIRSARKKLDEAQQLSEREQYDKARRLAVRAKVDAELAEAKALSEKARKAVRELKESIELLQEEIERNQAKS